MNSPAGSYRPGTLAIRAMTGDRIAREYEPCWPNPSTQPTSRIGFLPRSWLALVNRIDEIAVARSNLMM